MDFTDFPFKGEAPPTGACIQVLRPEAGLAVVVFDPPHRKDSFPVLDAPLLRDLDQVLARLENDTTLRGIVFRGRSTSQFLAGADVEGIAEITDAAVAHNAVTLVHQLFDRIAALQPRTVAAVGGPVPGGAFELSLACDRIVATDDRATRIGLPETQLGIIPGWGGTHRLPRRVGLPNALDAVLTGRLFPAKVAKKRGMIDRLTKAEYLERVAIDIAMGRTPCRRKKRGWKSWGVDRNPIAKAVIEHTAMKGLDAKANGKYPAPYKALDLLMSAPNARPGRWAPREAQAVAELATGSVCKSLVSLFFASEEAKKLAKDPTGAPVRTIDRACVVGAGVMGGAIASLLAEKGAATRLADLSSAALGESMADHEKQITRKVKKRRMERHLGEAAIDRLDATPEINGIGRAQFVIEAVAEVLEVKRKVLGACAEDVADDAILATNTSSLSVAAIAEGLPHPERVVGLHFFNPVRKMPLVEVVRGPQTSDEVVTATCALAVRLGKTPVVTQDVPGFLVNRVLGPYLDESVRLFLGGADPAKLDQLMLDFGMPMGPLRLLDEVGLDIAAHAAESLHMGYGARMTPVSLEGLRAPSRLGKKTGHGFYHHPKGKGGAKLADDLVNHQTGDWAASLTDSQLTDHMVLAYLNEAVRCLEEEVVAGPVELDLATVFGTGFAPFRGGVLRYADSRGADSIVRSMEAIRQSQAVIERGAAGDRFEAAALLRDCAGTGKRIHR